MRSSKRESLTVSLGSIASLHLPGFRQASAKEGGVDMVLFFGSAALTVTVVCAHCMEQADVVMGCFDREKSAC